jgi:hypothetical protein
VLKTYRNDLFSEKEDHIITKKFKIRENASNTEEYDAFDVTG